MKPKKKKKDKAKHLRKLKSVNFAKDVRPLIQEALEMVDNAVQQAIDEENYFERSEVEFYGTKIIFAELNGLRSGLEMALRVRSLMAAKKYLKIPYELLRTEGDLFRRLQNSMLV